MILGIAILAVLIVLYATVAVKLGRWSITMPIVFVAFGFLLGPGGTGWLVLAPEAEPVKVLTEITLALLLFADASTLKLVTVIQATQLAWQPLLYALLSLTVVRMGPVVLALRKTGLRRDTVALMGWFGPRGLASVVFTLLALEHFGTISRPVDTLLATAGWTILLSVVGHGLSAVPLSAWYARRLAAAGQPLAELADLSEMHQRHQTLAAPPA